MTTYCPYCGDEDTLETDDSGQLYCQACDHDIEEGDDTENPPDLDDDDGELARDRILEQQELSDFAQDDVWENDYDDSF